MQASADPGGLIITEQFSHSLTNVIVRYHSILLAGNIGYLEAAPKSEEFTQRKSFCGYLQPTGSETLSSCKSCRKLLSRQRTVLLTSIVAQDGRLPTQLGIGHPITISVSFLSISLSLSLTLSLSFFLSISFSPLLEMESFVIQFFHFFLLPSFNSELKPSNGSRASAERPQGDFST